MDLSQYVTDERIDEDIIAKLLDAKDGMATIYAVTTSVFKDERKIGGGFFSEALNQEHLLAKNYKPAKEKFDELYSELRKKYWLIKEISDQNYSYADFETSNFRNNQISFLKGFDNYELSQYGNKLRVAIKKSQIPLCSIVYDISEKAICYTYEDYSRICIPIVLD